MCPGEERRRRRASCGRPMMQARAKGKRKEATMQVRSDPNVRREGNRGVERKKSRPDRLRIRIGLVDLIQFEVE